MDNRSTFCGERVSERTREQYFSDGMLYEQNLLKKKIKELLSKEEWEKIQHLFQ